MLLVLGGGGQKSADKPSRVRTMLRQSGLPYSGNNNGRQLGEAAGHCNYLARVVLEAIHHPATGAKDILGFVHHAIHHQVEGIARHGIGHEQGHGGIGVQLVMQPCVDLGREVRSAGVRDTSARKRRIPRRALQCLQQC